MIFGGSSALASRLLLSWKSISNQAKFCATVTGLVKVDVPVQVLVERALEPLRQRQVTILAQQKELKGRCLAVEAELLDARRRAGEAQAQVTFQESRKQDLQRTISTLQETMDDIETKKNATMEEIRQKAREIGDEGADAKIEEVRKSPTLQQYMSKGSKSGSLIQEYAKLHFEVEEFKSKIQAAQTGSAKNEQVAAEHRKLREVAKEQASALEAALQELQKDQQAMRRSLDDVAKDEAQVNLQRQSLERTVDWAKSTSPVTPVTVETLGTLVITRAEAIRLALAISGSTHLQVLRDLKCAAFELRNGATTKTIASRLKEAGFSGEELKEMGFSARELHKADIRIKELFTGEELKEMGFSERELREIGTTVQAPAAAEGGEAPFWFEGLVGLGVLGLGFSLITGPK